VGVNEITLTRLQTEGAGPAESGFLIRKKADFNGGNPDSNRTVEKKGAPCRKQGLRDEDFLTSRQLAGLLSLKAGWESSLPTRAEVSLAAREAGYIIVPDIVREPLRTGKEEIVTLVPVFEGESLSQGYPIAHLLIELGVAVALADGRADDVEIVQLSYVMEKRFRFTELEIRALTALKDFSLRYPPRIAETARRLSGMLPREDCVEVAKMMITIAAAGGQVARNERSALVMLFGSLGLDENELDRAISELFQKRVWVLIKNG
jgi:uncharacterized tellurite resistance protein B-like protein